MKEEANWDLLDRIQENTKGWENDKGRKSCINYDYECIKSFMGTDDFHNISDVYGLDSQILANFFKAFASYLDVPKKNGTSTMRLIKILLIVLLLEILKFVLLIVFCLNLILRKHCNIPSF
jgi:hypothetical protein